MIRFGLLIATVWVASLCSVTYAQDRGFASAIEWSPDGETIAVASSTGVWFFDTDFNELGLVKVKHFAGNSPRSLNWNAAGDLLAVGYPMVAEDSPIQIIDVSKLEIITEIGLPGLWTQVIWHPEDSLIVVGSYGGTAHIWNAITGEEIFYFEESAENLDWNNPTVAFCWLTENSLVITTQWEVYVVSLVENKTIHTFRVPRLKASDCNRDYRLISITGDLVDLQTGSNAKLFDSSEFVAIDDGHVEGYFLSTLSVAWSPESGHIVTSQEGCRIRVFDRLSGELVTEVNGGIYLEELAFSFFQDSIAWHPDGSRFAVVGQFGDIRVWDADSFELLQRFDGFEISDFGGYLEHLSEEVLQEAMDVCGR